MQRVTARNDRGKAYYPKCFQKPCYGWGCRDKSCCFLDEACERLAAYEDTGLTPEEMTEIKGQEMAEGWRENSRKRFGQVR